MNRSSFSRSLGVGILLTALLLAYAVFSDRGLLKVQKLSAEKEAMSEAVRLIEDQNRALQKEKSSLNNNLTTIERAARENLDMARSDEIIYKFVE